MKRVSDEDLESLRRLTSTTEVTRIFHTERIALAGAIDELLALRKVAETAAEYVCALDAYRGSQGKDRKRL